MPTAPKPRRRRRWLLLGLLGLAAGVVVYAAVPGKNTHTVSPETTYVTGPLDADGRVDYVAALNTRLRGDITPEQNANVLIWQAIGLRPEGSPPPDEYFQWLGRPAPPEDGVYLVRWDKFVRAQAKEPEEIVAPAEEFGPPPGPPGVDDMAFHNERLNRAKKWPWAAADEPDLAEWVTKNARPLAAFTQASTRPAYYNPLTPKRNAAGKSGLLLATLLPSMQACRDGANLLAARAMLHLGAGRTDEAWQDLITCHRLGRLLERGGTLIEYLVGVAIQLIAIQGETTFLSQAKLSAARVAACRADLGRLPPPARVADKVDLTERFVMLDFTQWLAHATPDELTDLEKFGPPPPAAPAGRLFARGIDWDPAMREINRWYDRWAAAIRLDDFQARDAAMAGLVRELKLLVEETKEAQNDWWAAPFRTPAGRGKLAGEIVVSRVFPAAHKIAAAETRVAQRHRNLTVAFALAAHRADTGMYPPALADLAPKYLPTVPQDIYTNADLIYRPAAAGYLFYSVGPNRIDDQGRDKHSEIDGDDLAVEMPAKEPPPVKKPAPEPE